MMIMDLEPQILCSGSLFKEKWITFKKRFFKALKVIFVGFSFIWTNIKLKYKNWWSHFYHRVHANINSFKKKMRKVFLIFDLVLGCIDGILFLINVIFNATGHGKILNNTPLIIIWTIGATISFQIAFYVAFSLFFKWYHKMYGEELVHELDREYTFEYVIEYAPRIAKGHGYTGIGKDELLAGLTTMQIEGFKKEIQKQIDEIKSICYIFNFNLIEAVLPYNLDLFFSSSETTTKTNFLGLAEKFNYFIKKIYLRKINLEEFIEDSRRLKSNVLYTSKYIYDKGGITKKHFLNMLYDYVMLRVRQYENKFLLSNQPFIEDMESGQPAAKFSLNYVTTKHQPDRSFNEKNAIGQTETVQYEEKVQFPFKDFIGIIETEAATWYINLERQILALLQALGIRDFKAFNRHILPHFFWYQADQDPNRVVKLFRELDHYYIYPDTRVIYQGGEALNIQIRKQLNKFSSKLEKIALKQESCTNKNTRLDNKINRIERYWIASSKRRYKNKVDALKDKKKYFNLDAASQKFEELCYDLQQEMALNIYNHSYIDKIVTIGREPVTNAGRPVLKPKDILDNPDLIKTSYSVKLTFRLSDCWRYNTHYMAKVGKNRADKSELNLIDAKTWNMDLELHDEDVIDMGYMQGAELMGIDPQKILKSRYKKKSNDSYL